MQFRNLPSIACQKAGNTIIYGALRRSWKAGHYFLRAAWTMTLYYQPQLFDRIMASDYAAPRIFFGSFSMLRFLAWRVLFEVCNCRRLLGHGSGRVRYLAFGANLSPDIMRERRIEPLQTRYFTLRDHGLRFDHPAAWSGCGYASAEPAAGESVYGILYTLSERDAARMDFYEMVPVVGRYRRSWVEQDGERLYYYQTNRSTPELRPTDQYLGYIVDGLASHPQVEAAYRERLSQTPTGIPGRYVATYLGERTPLAWPSLDAAACAYRKFTTFLFLKVLYRLSPTAVFIRQRP